MESRNRYALFILLFLEVTWWGEIFLFFSPSFRILSDTSLQETPINSRYFGRDLVERLLEDRALTMSRFVLSCLGVSSLEAKMS